MQLVVWMQLMVIKSFLLKLKQLIRLSSVFVLALVARGMDIIFSIRPSFFEENHCISETLLLLARGLWFW